MLSKVFFTRSVRRFARERQFCAHKHDLHKLDCINTKGNALSVPLECCLFSCLFRYFFFAGFFAAFLAAFFAGAFLAFLVAICLFSLFDGLHRFCNLKIAVEECIDSSIIDVKKKTT